MKAYKITDKNIRCRRYQYEIGKTHYHEGEVVLGSSGFHASKNPLDCYMYRGPHGSRLWEVECGGKIIEDVDKIACSEITFLRELTLREWHGAAMAVIMLSNSDSVASGDGSQSSTMKPRRPSLTLSPNTHSMTLGSRAHSLTSGPNSHSSTIGECSPSSTSGYCSHSSTIGFQAPSFTSGNYARSVTIGTNSISSTTGDNSHSSTMGYSAHSSTAGSYANSSTTGYSAHSSTTGDCSHSSTTGDCSHSSTTGDLSHSMATGADAHSEVSGDDSIAVSIGLCAKASVDSTSGWIVIASYDRQRHITRVVSGKPGDTIDAVKIKQGYWYWFEDGKIREEKKEV